MEKWRIRWFGLVLSSLAIVGCAHATGGSETAAERQIQQLEQENAALKVRAAALDKAQEELRWLHIHLEKHPAIDPPQSAVEAYLQAFIRRNGAAARIYLSEPMRADMPTHGIGTSDWPFRRYEILSQTEVTADKYQFAVRLCGEETVCAGKPEIYTVENQPSDIGNDSWLITDISSSGPDEVAQVQKLETSQQAVERAKVVLGPKKAARYEATRLDSWLPTAPQPNDKPKTVWKVMLYDATGRYSGWVILDMVTGTPLQMGDV